MVYTILGSILAPCIYGNSVAAAGRSSAGAGARCHRMAQRSDMPTGAAVWERRAGVPTWDHLQTLAGLIINKSDNNASISLNL